MPTGTVIRLGHQPNVPGKTNEFGLMEVRVAFICVYDVKNPGGIPECTPTCNTASMQGICEAIR